METTPKLKSVDDVFNHHLNLPEVDGTMRDYRVHSFITGKKYTKIQSANIGNATATRKYEISDYGTPKKK